MNEPKRRGRPPKISVQSLVDAGVVTPIAPTDAEMRPAVEALAASIEADMLAQAYALRVWEGQSESADRSWRMQRVKEALEGQGLSMEGVELP